MKAAKIRQINGRRRIPMWKIRAVVKQIATKFEPEKVILFGSYTYGKPKPESDVDLLVVMDTPLTIPICQQWSEEYLEARLWRNPNMKQDCTVGMMRKSTSLTRPEWIGA